MSNIWRFHCFGRLKLCFDKYYVGTAVVIKITYVTLGLVDIITLASCIMYLNQHWDQTADPIWSLMWRFIPGIMLFNAL